MGMTCGTLRSCGSSFRKTELDKKVDVQVARNGKPVTLSAKIKEEPPNYGLARALPPGAARTRHTFA